MAEAPLLSLHGYGLVHRTNGPVLRDISFDLGHSEILCIVGESGSGKSQLLLSLLGLAMPGAAASGSARLSSTGLADTELAGTELAGATEAVLRPLRGRQMGMLFQDPLLSWNPCRTIGSQLREVPSLRGEESAQVRRRMLQALRDVELQEPERLLRCYPHQLSGGMRQRAMLAMAVLGQPRLLLADEPTTALDPTTQQRVLQHLRRLRAQQGMSILLVTHDLGVVAQIADRVLVLEKGCIVEQGTVAAVLGAPSSPHARRLVQAARQLEGLPCLA
ncbi:MAG TPA: ABC transporter ATP-binding protein [Steroidobacteraceae bacterium]|nr:ABC transporter ATP-binding protein [Steroidobacteraceae bacterium]